MTAQAEAAAYLAVSIKACPPPSAQVSDTPTLFCASADHRLRVKAAREKRN